MFAFGFVDHEDVRDGVPITCEPVSMVTGPGNIWVVAAKRLLKGLIGIDAEAGPTEIAILADSSADAEHVAADLVSQAEHDLLAASVLVTDSEELAEAVAQALARRARDEARRARGNSFARQAVPHRARRRHGHRSGVVNAYAAEHLEIQTRDASAVAGESATPARSSSAPTHR